MANIAQGTVLGQQRIYRRRYRQQCMNYFANMAQWSFSLCFNRDLLRFALILIVWALRWQWSIGLSVEQKFICIVETPPFVKSTDYLSPWKSPILLGLHSSCERGRKPVIKFNIDPEVFFFIFRLIPRKSDFRELIAFFDTTPISHFWGGSL
jgi:hypothetical protein